MPAEWDGERQVRAARKLTEMDGMTGRVTRLPDRQTGGGGAVFEGRGQIDAHGAKRGLASARRPDKKIVAALPTAGPAQGSIAPRPAAQPREPPAGRRRGPRDRLRAPRPLIRAHDRRHLQPRDPRQGPRGSTVL